jgi:formyl-CoA transferase
VLEVPALENDPRFIDNNSRMAHRPELIAELERSFEARTTDEWVDLLLAAGVPAGPIRDYSEVLRDDPHVKARNMVITFDHPVEGTTPVLASPIKMYGTPVRVDSPPPLLGQHTDEVLSEILPRVAAAEERS